MCGVLREEASSAKNKIKKGFSSPRHFPSLDSQQVSHIPKRNVKLPFLKEELNKCDYSAFQIGILWPYFFHSGFHSLSFSNTPCLFLYKPLSKNRNHYYHRFPQTPHTRMKPGFYNEWLHANRIELCKINFQKRI